MAKLYEAELMALEPQVLRKSIAMVGLLPWNPSLIRENCQKHSPPDLDSDPKDEIDEIAQRMNKYTIKQREEIERLRSRVKQIGTPTMQKIGKRRREAGASLVNQADGDEEKPTSSSEDSMTTSTESPKKRTKIMQMERKTCAAAGCQKSHFWSKKWVSCEKCKKSFCEEHQELIHHHDC